MHRLLITLIICWFWNFTGLIKKTFFGFKQVLIRYENS